jgi:subtilisin-like proprotein convertase family protein
MKRIGVALVAVTLASGASASASGDSPRPTPLQPAGPSRAVQRPSGGIPSTLWDQSDGPGSNSVGSQDFEPALSFFNDEAADDFVVPAGTAWSIEEAFFVGGYSPGGGPAAALNVTVYADAAGTPGGVICSYPLLDPIDLGGSLWAMLPHPCVVRGGTYWIAAQARQDLATAGQWYWLTRAAQNGNESHWRNPGNGYGTGCLVFSPVSSCLSGTEPDLRFWLAGHAIGVVPPPPAECGTFSQYFDNGIPVPIPDSGGGAITSTIDVSGLTGTIWDVNALTFITHTWNADLQFTIQSPSGTVVTLSSNNGGSNDNVFNGTVWDDQASPGGQVPYDTTPGLVTDNPYVNGVAATPLAPEEGLSAFIGEDPNGTWTITVADTSAGDVGTLNAWGLQISTLQGTITTTSISYPSNNVSVPIPDQGGVISTIDASAHRGSFLCQLKVTTNITHTYPADLDITIMSPSGKIATLSTDNGGSADDAFNGTTWEDGYNALSGQVPYSNNDGLVTDQAYTSGVPVLALVPEEALALFVGDDPRGLWTLTISDDSPNDSGTLNSWSLEIRTCTCAHAEQASPLRVDEHPSGGSSDLNGVFEAGETVLVEPAWFNPGTTAFDLSGYVVSFSGPFGPNYTIDDPVGSYGTILAGETANCFDATGDCYVFTIDAAARPAQHWDATFQEAAGEVSARQTPDVPSAVTDRPLHVGESFPDVARSSPFYRFVETIFHKGVTGGCAAAPNYCPGDLALRKQMAVFVLKAKEGSAYTPPAAVGVFTDVPASDPFAPWIEELFHRGVVGGCGAGPAYCPNNPVLRQQMAVFLLKTALGSGYTPPPATGIFGDVPASNPFAPWIEDLANRGIAAGCGGNNFCPTNPTTRGQMAPFLVKTFSLLLYGP